jgi:hypothetical protein
VTALDTRLRCLVAYAGVRTRRTTLVASAVALVALVAVPSSSFALDSVVLPTSLAAGVPARERAQEPARMVFGADGRTALIDLAWSGWGEPASTAQAVWRSDFGPAGEPAYYEAPATVTATDIKRCDGVLTYTQLSLVSSDPEAGIFPTNLTELWHRCSPALSTTAKTTPTALPHRCSNAGAVGALFVAEVTARHVSCSAARRFIVSINDHRLGLKVRSTHYRGYGCHPRPVGGAGWRIRCTRGQRVIRWIEGT